MPWHIWLFPQGLLWSAVAARNESIWLLGLKTREWTDSLGAEKKAVQGFSYTLSGNTDSLPAEAEEGQDYLIEQTPVSAMLQTKVFDFDRPERRKTIRRLHIGATDTADGYIRLSYITERGIAQDALLLQDYGSGDMREWTATPGVNRVRQFGIRAESDGAMAVVNLVVRYEVNGEVR